MSDFLKGVGTGLIGSNGISRAVNSFALAPYIAAAKEKQAMSEAALADMRAAQAGNEWAKLDARNAAKQLYETATDPRDKELGRILRFATGDSSAENIAKASALNDKAMRLYQILSGGLDRNKVAGATAAVEGKPMYGAAPDGYSRDHFTGEEIVTNPALASLTRAVKGSLANQHNASAANSYASAGLHRGQASLIPYQRDKIISETEYRNARKDNPERYSRSSSRGITRQSGYTPSVNDEMIADLYKRGKITREQAINMQRGNR